MIRTLLAFGISGAFAQAATPDLPGIDSVLEKGGVWALVGMLMWWILGVLSKKLDSLGASIDKLADKIDSK